MSENFEIIFFFQFMFKANLQPSGSRLMDAWSIKLIFSLLVTFYLTEIENKFNKSLLIQVLCYFFE